MVAIYRGKLLLAAPPGLVRRAARHASESSGGASGRPEFLILAATGAGGPVQVQCRQPAPRPVMTSGTWPHCNEHAHATTTLAAAHWR